MLLVYSARDAHSHSLRKLSPLHHVESFSLALVTFGVHHRAPVLFIALFGDPLSPLSRTCALFSLFFFFSFFLSLFLFFFQKKKTKGTATSIFLSPLPELPGALWTPPWVRVSDTPLLCWYQSSASRPCALLLILPFLWFSSLENLLHFFSQVLCGGPLGGGLELL